MTNALIIAYLVAQVVAIAMNPITILAIPAALGILVVFHWICKWSGFWKGVKTRPDRGEFH